MTSAGTLAQQPEAVAQRAPFRALLLARGCTSSSPAKSSRYDAELIANAHGIPSVAITPAALAGPIARARLNVIELSATACGTSSSSTSAAISDCCAGIESALTIPSAPEKPITTHSVAAPPHASPASTAVSAVDVSCVASSSLRRSSAVGKATRPRREHEHGHELAEVEDAEQERRVRQPEDEDRRGEVLEPRAARRRRVADEVRREVARADHPPRGARPDLRCYARPVRCSCA